MVVCSCSTTKHLPEGEVLYTGVERIDEQVDDTLDADVRLAVNTLLEVEPNSSLLGSAYHQSPFPFGLWIYNGLYTEKEKGLRHWLWNKLKSEPTLISQVNPVLRCQAAEVAIHDEGYFDGRVSYELQPNKRNSKKAKVLYSVQYGRASRLSSIQYMPNHDGRLDSIIAHTRHDSRIQEGDRFSAKALLAEKSRIGTLMVDSGYFNYSSAFVKYMADTTRTPFAVALRVFTDYKASATELRPCRVDSVQIRLDYGSGLSSKKFIYDGHKSIGYRGKLKMKPKYLFPCLSVEEWQLYNTRIGSRVTTRLARLNTFKYNNVEWKVIDDTPSATIQPEAYDTLRYDNQLTKEQKNTTTKERNDTTSLLLSLSSTYAMPWTGSIELKTVYKDNNQVGPGLAFQAQRRNLFGGGELLSFGIDAGYEWNTGKHTIGENNGLLNSYELGGKVSLSIPRLQLPLEVDEDLPVTTTYSLSADVMSRAGFFKMFKATAEMSYSFSTSPVNTHIFTPIQLTYTSLLSTTDKFDSIVSSNRVLMQSFADQFIPSIRYTYIFDNSTIARGRSRQWMQVSVVEAGGILDAVMGRVGAHRTQGERQLLWQPFSQFAKASIDLRNYIDLGRRQTLAMRALGGIAYAYGNSETVPYSEQFFIGGANSLRGFSIRSVGPGTFRTNGGKYSYMDQTGDVKLEANIEWRFPLSGDIYGALFADAGNVWTLRNEESRSGGQLTSTFFNELASDCGFGLRYDLGMLVLRFDVGVPLHDPSESDSKYYNLSGSFFGNLGYHLAIGYPF